MVAGMLSFTILTVYLALMAFAFGETSELEYSHGIPKLLWACTNSLFSGLNKMQSFSVGLIDIQTVLHQAILTGYFLFLASIQIDRFRK